MPRSGSSAPAYAHAYERETDAAALRGLPCPQLLHSAVRAACRDGVGPQTKPQTRPQTSQAGDSLFFPTASIIHNAALFFCPFPSFTFLCFSLAFSFVSSSPLRSSRPFCRPIHFLSFLSIYLPPAGVHATRFFDSISGDVTRAVSRLTVFQFLDAPCAIVSTHQSRPPTSALSYPPNALSCSNLRYPCVNSTRI